jgi:outer membrane protein assembly factor BamB
MPTSTRLVLVAAAAAALVVGLGVWVVGLLETQDPLGVNETDAPSQPGGPLWPGWGGPGRNQISSDTGLLDRWPSEGPPELWRVRGGGGYSGFALADGRLITMVGRGGAEVVLCLDAADGRQIWAVRSDDDRTDSFGDGPRSTPLIDGRRVYTLGASGVLLCLDVRDGSELWRLDLVSRFGAAVPKWGFSTSPLLEGDKLIVNVGGRPGASFVAFDKADGRVLWKCLDDPPGYSSPIAISVDGMRQIVQTTGVRLVGLSPDDGRLLWEIPWKNQYETNIATPVWWADEKMIFISSGYEKDALAARLSVADGKVRAEVVWESPVLKNHQADSILRHGRLYGIHGNGTGVLKCVEMQTGRQVWVDRCVGKGTVFFADGHLYVLSDKGEMALVAADPTGVREKGRFRPLSGKCWTAPLVIGGRMYLRNEKEIACYGVAKAAG